MFVNHLINDSLLLSSFNSLLIDFPCKKQIFAKDDDDDGDDDVKHNKDNNGFTITKNFKNNKNPKNNNNNNNSLTMNSSGFIKNNKINNKNTNNNNNNNMNTKTGAKEDKLASLCKALTTSPSSLVRFPLTSINPIIGSLRLPTSFGHNLVKR